ncbi:hypothetical protein TWF506_005482 [Arthrobotrys conoides]|uniref:Uncharacterized protein n=1 Tax=Arthrobotrys conoides TaxID=74498 RepID=A0AAN8RWV4_9PEZI
MYLIFYIAKPPQSSTRLNHLDLTQHLSKPFGSIGFYLAMSFSLLERGRKFINDFTMNGQPVMDNTVSQTRSSPRKQPPPTSNSSEFGIDKKKRGYKKSYPDHNGRGYRSHHSSPRKSDPLGPVLTGPQNITQRSKTDTDTTHKTIGESSSNDQYKSVLAEDSISLQVKPAEQLICIDFTQSDGHKSFTTERVGSRSPEIPFGVCLSPDSAGNLGSHEEGLCKLCRAYRQVDELNDKLVQSELERAEAIRFSNWSGTELEKLGTQLVDLDSRLQQLTQSNIDWKFGYDDLKREYLVLQANHSAVVQKLQTTEQEIGKLQKTELARLYREEALLDTIAKDHLSNDLFTKVKAITRHYFRRIPWKSSVKNFPNLDKMLPGMFAAQWTKSPWPMIRDNPDFSTPALVDAILFSTITTKFFKNPFFRAENDPTVKQALDDVYSSGRQKDAKSIEHWRKSTVALLKELSLKGAGDHQNPIQREGIETGPPQPILTEVLPEIEPLLINILSLHNAITSLEAPKLGKKISDLVSSSASLADDWNSRDFRLCIIDVEWLQSKGIDWCTEGASKYVTVFPKNKRLEENVNYKIAAVITPGFIRYEKGDTEGSEIEIIWEPASVLLEEEHQGGVGIDTHQYY